MRAINFAADRPADALSGLPRDAALRNLSTRGDVVVVTGVSKRYGAQRALANVTLSVRPGEVFGLLGPNGAGKTTLLEIIEGVREADAGSVQVLGSGAHRRDLRVRRRLGVCLQDAILPPRLRVIEVVRLFTSIYGLPLTTGTAALDRFGLSAKATALCSDLSQGQKQRLSLALALQHEPELLVIDEPTTGLDVEGRADVHREIRDLRSAGRTVLLTTHDLEEANQLCDRLAVIRDGQIVAEGTPADLCRTALRPSVVRVALTRPLPPWLIERLRETGDAVRAEQGGSLIVLESHDAGAAVMELSRCAMDADSRFTNIEVRSPRLEDAFVEIIKPPSVS